MRRPPVILRFAPFFADLSLAALARAGLLRAALFVTPGLFLLCAAPALAQVPPLANPSFHKLDTDHDGRVTLAEVLVYAEARSAAVKPFRIADVDKNGDGILSPEEFKKAGITGFERFGAVRARDLDISGDGYVSREELDRYFALKHGEAFERADADHDGALSRSEFVLFRFK